LFTGSRKAALYALTMSTLSPTLFDLLHCQPPLIGSVSFEPVA
jgi:hypothetical protein